MLKQLPLDKRRRFIYAEISYFSVWWEKLDETQRATVRRLIEDGQLEIVTGGWVMTDEANSHYYAIIDQLIEGHQWLELQLGVKPTSGWSIDPFGHSSTMAYILKRVGLTNMLLQRVHYSVKKHFAREKQLEFMWRQNWDHNSSTDMFTHMMPFYSYDVPHTCGPDPKICCQFDFKRLPLSKVRCPWRIPAQAITDTNVHERSHLLLDQYRKKSLLYRSNVVLVPLGDDFRWDTTKEWDDQITNYQKLFDYMNKQAGWNVEAKFGTLKEYFDAIWERNDVLPGQRPPGFPVISGDFFTYADKDDHYWAGYFTTRPFYKNMDRVLEAALRQLYTCFMFSQVIVQDMFTGKQVEAQVNPVWEDWETISDTRFELVFVARLPAIGLRTYNVTAVSKVVATTRLGKVALFNSRSFNKQTKSVFSVVIPPSPELLFSIENAYMRALFSPRSGLLQSVTLKEDDTRVKTELEFLKYGTREKSKDKSGAYLFLPDGEAKPLVYAAPLVRVVRGNIVSEVHVFLPHVEQVVRLTNSPGVDIVSLDIVNLVDIKLEKNKELVMRVYTDVTNHNREFYTDLNGFQMQKRRTRPSMPLQADVYPMSTMAYVESESTRVSILTGQALGCTSRDTGQLEVIQDRRLMQDDQRGLMQGLLDNKRTANKFRLLVERRQRDRVDKLKVGGGSSSNTSVSFPSLLRSLVQRDDAASDRHGNAERRSPRHAAAQRIRRPR
ncbi:PREDICTED: alpha-mannosidase 2x-like [Priapulus caudatus]|uniref:Alpha-mannosidase 2x-like n=1 Tax=Priapulus caudatus TaxID=37621 RepID=A0ABM1F5H0_PRICU|nr:PREDICTED: alpha-mannosidase 2x-like [Priapulus caudatus]